jgi:hypothetical protein
MKPKGLAEILELEASAQCGFTGIDAPLGNGGELFGYGCAIEFLA